MEEFMFSHLSVYELLNLIALNNHTPLTLGFQTSFLTQHLPSGTLLYSKVPAVPPAQYLLPERFWRYDSRLHLKIFIVIRTVTIADSVGKQ